MEARLDKHGRLKVSAGWKEEVLLPTDFLVSRRGYRAARVLLTAAAGGAGSAIRSCRSGWQWTDWRVFGAGSKCGERPREAGAREGVSEVCTNVWKAK